LFFFFCFFVVIDFPSWGSLWVLSCCYCFHNRPAVCGLVALGHLTMAMVQAVLMALVELVAVVVAVKQLLLVEQEAMLLPELQIQAVAVAVVN